MIVEVTIKRFQGASIREVDVQTQDAQEAAREAILYLLTHDPRAFEGGRSLSWKIL